VNLNVLIGTDGRIKRASVLSGNRRLGEAAVRAVRLWRYRGRQLNGQPAEAETDVSVSYFGDDAVSIKFLPRGSFGLVETHRRQ
jgi:TonB family protein